MFSDHINKVELSDVAKEFLQLLEKYQGNYEAARNVLSRSRNLIMRAIIMEIDTPLGGGYFPDEFWEDGELFLLDDLGNAVAKFNLLLRGAGSLNEIRHSVDEIESQANKIEKELRDQHEEK
jgi:hypothetical protein